MTQRIPRARTRTTTRRIDLRARLVRSEATLASMTAAIESGDRDAALVEAARLRLDLQGVERSLAAYQQRGETPSEAASFARVAKRAAEIFERVPTRIEGAAGFRRFLDRFGAKSRR